MSTTRSFLLTWLLVVLYVAVVLLLVFAQGLLDQRGWWSYRASLPFFVAAQPLALITFLYWIYRLYAPSAYRQARARGVPTLARILDVRPTGWKLASKSARPGRREYRFHLEVESVGVPPYEAVAYEYLLDARPLLPGVIIPVRVHPARPAVVAVVESELPSLPAAEGDHDRP